MVTMPCVRVGFRYNPIIHMKRYLILTIEWTNRKLEMLFFEKKKKKENQNGLLKRAKAAASKQKQQELR